MKPELHPESERRVGPVESGDSVGRLVEDIERFLGNWMERLTGLMEYARQLTEREAAVDQREASLTRWAAELKEQRQRWVVQRDEEVRQLQEQVEQLTEAWLQLEQEQRGLLQAQDPNQSRSRESSRPTSQAEPPRGPCEYVGGPPSGPASPHPSFDESAPTVSPPIAPAQPVSRTDHRQPTKINQSGNAAASINDKPTDESVAREAAIQQFEKLQREIGFGFRAVQ